MSKRVRRPAGERIYSLQLGKEVWVKTVFGKYWWKVQVTNVHNRNKCGMGVVVGGKRNLHLDIYKDTVIYIGEQ